MSGPRSAIAGPCPPPPRRLPPPPSRPPPAMAAPCGRAGGRTRGDDARVGQWRAEGAAQDGGCRAAALWKGGRPPEPAAAAQPDPEEFDNSTYKNLQHHEYNMYTFIDSVVVLSKFRQPQPSSGRPSPRH
uniref:NADH dehydrogenase [ubiquinone] flavoprotein 3, mitochondrial n=1 Tax=Anas platyrhynchos TaxID=8839 RepID=A0A8B9QNH1_ANAPL